MKHREMTEEEYDEAGEACFLVGEIAIAHQSGDKEKRKELIDRMMEIFASSYERDLRKI